MNPRWLTLDDIEDLRAYERNRPELRRRVIEAKKARRVPLGEMLSLVFENRETVRFQIQEMARAERMLSDEQILGELEAYNPLIPAPGELSATMFIELTGEEALREWLPKLVGIERAVELVIGEESSGQEPIVIPSKVEPSHEAMLSRQDVTASVHYVRFAFEPAAIERFAGEPVELRARHRAYHASTQLGEDTKKALLEDLVGP